jgi:hypothetical protein
LTGLCISIGLALVSLAINVYLLVCVRQLRSLIRDNGEICDNRDRSAGKTFGAINERIDDVEKQSRRHKWN